MLKILKWYLIITLLIVLIWPFGQKYLPDSFRQSEFAIALNALLDPVLEYAHVKSFVTEGGDIHASQIVEANPKVFESLNIKIKTQKIKTVLYFFDAKRLVDRLAYSQLNDLALNFSKAKNMAIIPVAVADNRMVLSDFLNNIPQLNTSIIFVETSKLNDVSAELGLKLDLSKSPNFIYIDNQGKITGEGLTLEFKDKVNDFLLK